MPLSSAFSVIACPLRLSIHGITIGFLGAPRSPIVDAIGMPSSMCVAWMSPFDSESRIAAQLAPFTIVELMPYFLKRPFSCAITIGELSVSAMMPKRTSGVSGPLVPGTLALLPAALGAPDDSPGASDLLHPGKAAAIAAPVRPLSKFLRSMRSFIAHGSRKRVSPRFQNAIGRSSCTIL